MLSDSLNLGCLDAIVAAIPVLVLSLQLQKPAVVTERLPLVSWRWSFGIKTDEANP